MSNPIVERVARCLHIARHGTRTPWERVSEQTRQGHREIVEEVLLAAMNAGLAIREVGVVKCDTCGTVAGVIMTDSIGVRCVECRARPVDLES